MQTDEDDGLLHIAEALMVCVLLVHSIFASKLVVQK